MYFVPDGPPTVAVTASGRRKRKDTGCVRVTPVRVWSEEEDRLFIEALELYGAFCILLSAGACNGVVCRQELDSGC